jgi:hypothetical protein
MSNEYERMLKLMRLRDDSGATDGERFVARKKIFEVYEGMKVSETINVQPQPVNGASPADKVASQIKLAMLIEQAMAKACVTALVTPVNVEAHDESGDVQQVAITPAQLLHNICMNLQELADAVDENTAIAQEMTEAAEEQTSKRRKRRR